MGKGVVSGLTDAAVRAVGKVSFCIYRICVSICSLRLYALAPSSAPLEDPAGVWKDTSYTTYSIHLSTHLSPFSSPGLRSQSTSKLE